MIYHFSSVYHVKKCVDGFRCGYRCGGVFNDLWYSARVHNTSRIFFKLSKTSHQLFQFIRIGLYWFTGENLQETIAVTLRDFLQDIPETTGVIAASGQPGVEGRLLLRPDGVPGTPWGVSRATWQRGMGVLFVKWNGIGQLDHVES